MAKNQPVKTVKPDDVLGDAEAKMQKALAGLHHELQTIRTGRANPGMLDRVSVDYHGTATNIKQVAIIAVPDARTITLAPYEKSLLGEIEKALQRADLGITPTNDGTVIRLNLPPLTEERRKDLTKQVKKHGEEAKVGVRNARREAADVIKKKEKDGLPKDDAKRLDDQLTKLTDKLTAEVDKIVLAKDNEILAK
ncbi:MAG: ribosome recycling factor [Candidatus Sericytochromatia bacterium]|nr:ribosome recycling factor [Candidatus Sericytochromatia bacterium]